MVIFVDKKATGKQIKQMAKDYEGYIKLVVDMERGVLAGGGERHADGEQFRNFCYDY